MPERKMTTKIRIKKGPAETTLRVYNAPHGMYSAGEVAEKVHLEDMRVLEKRGFIERGNAKLKNVNRESLKNLKSWLEKEHPDKRFDLEATHLEDADIDLGDAKLYKKKIFWEHRTIKEIIE